MVERLAGVMETELNCSSRCESPLCNIQLEVSRQEGLDILQRLCSLIKTDWEPQRRSLSPVLTAVMWTLFSCGIFLAFCFLFFTVRFRNNRIVKMSSPNLNVLTLCGSVLAYISGFLFAVEDRSHGGASWSVLQARIWTLCLGSTLVFGPILGKTWRLYRVFTQRVPDKRVIIRDIQLIGMVFLLLMVDVIVLTGWNFTDPVRCSRSVTAVTTVIQGDVSSSLSQLDTCSSVYSEVWIIIIAVQKGCLLLYGTYLAGLTSNVSHPPVNQSPTIITAVTLVTLSSAVAVPVSTYLQAWPNLVYAIIAGAIFISTLATNCMLFVPQLTQCRQFEEDQNNPSQMAKYFSSPSKSQPSMYSHDEIYYLLGENDSMKKLLSEKNVVIESLQEQVNSAKDKLLWLMTESRPPRERVMDRSDTNLNSSSTQTMGLQSEDPSSSLSQLDMKSRLSSCHVTPAPVLPVREFYETSSAPNSLVSVSSPLPEDASSCEVPTDVSKSNTRLKESTVGDDLTSLTFPARTAEEAVHFVTSLQTQRRLNPLQGDSLLGPGGLTLQTKPAGFVSSEQLKEILQELSVDAIMETTLRSPGLSPRTPSLLKLNTQSPLSLQTPQAPHPPVLFCYPSISPSMMRKRRPPFHSSRRGLAPPCLYKGPQAPSCRKTKVHYDLPSPEGHAVTDGVFHDPCSDPEVERDEEDEEGAKCRRCVLKFHSCPGQNLPAPADTEETANRKQLRKNIRDSSGYWDSDSSSSTDYCYYHRPYCDSCMQRGSLLSDSSSDSSDSEFDDYISLCPSARPVVFKEDLKPTFV
ncbi:probable G-protein coupled receptor 156 [Oryzias melastigma]|uniref:G protein-coupled receptor 156 n=1 Tax=Oryzias melastigma TaxID=30732 RepID=A0A3B3BPD8_ORYME|nr:probable G-protein coupled receptor 156 [Oryzias melastigma]